MTETVGAPRDRHTDVSLWYVISVGRGLRLVPDDREMCGVRWWDRGELAVADPARFDPHLARFLAKIDDH